MTAFVLGNGLSRLAVDVAVLHQRGPVYGCNALYRTHTPTVLVATDQLIARAIQDSGYARKNRFYTRKPRAELGGLAVPKKYYGFSSGPIAVSLAAQDGHDPIYMIGFDMGPDQQGRFNNVYAGTEFYKPENSVPTFPGNWARQIRVVISDYIDRKFVRVCGHTTAEIKVFDGASNLEHMDLSRFLELINTPKEI